MIRGRWEQFSRANETTGLDAKLKIEFQDVEAWERDSNNPTFSLLRPPPPPLSLSSLYIEIEETFKIELDFPGCSVGVLVFFICKCRRPSPHEYALMSSKRIGIIRVEWAAGEGGGREGGKKERKRGRGEYSGARCRRVTRSRIIYQKFFATVCSIGVGVANCRGDIAPCEIHSNAPCKTRPLNFYEFRPGIN